MGQAGTCWWLWLAAVDGVQPAAGDLPDLHRAAVQQVQPLEDEALKERIEALMQLRLACKGLFVMDGSGAGRGNAYFTGFGAAKRIVFFDTLLARLDREEVEAVLAHELGHSSSPHRQAHGRDVCAVAGVPGPARLAGHARGSTGWACCRTSAAATTRWRWCCSSWCCRCSPSSWPAGQRSSRKHEFEADAFAATRPMRPSGLGAGQAVQGQRLDADARPALQRVLLLASAGAQRIAACWRTHDPQRAPSQPGKAPARTPSESALIVAAHGRHYVVERADGTHLHAFPRGKKSDAAVGDHVR
jgi:hypothetical protein